MKSAAPWSVRGDHVLLTVRLTPRAAQDRIDGIAVLADGTAVLAVRVRALPEDSAANQSLCVLIAKTLGVPKRAVDLVAGQTGRVKTVRIDREPDAIIPILSARVAGNGFA